MNRRLSPAIVVDASASLLLAAAVAFAAYAAVQFQPAIAAAAALGAGGATFTMLRKIGARSRPKVQAEQLGELVLFDIAGSIGAVESVPSSEPLPTPLELQRRIEEHFERPELAAQEAGDHSSEEEPTANDVEPAEEFRQALDELRRALR